MGNGLAISVVIPVYNSLPYLAKCIDSVLAQTFSPKEIICIDDGSTDGSLELLQKYSGKYGIRVIENSWPHGQAFARNQGIRAAKGDSIYFMDSDDWLDADYLQVMNAALSKGYDCVANTSIIYEYPTFSKRWESNLLAADDEIGKPFTAKKHILWFPAPVWAHMYRTSFLRDQNLYFPSGYKTDPYIHEDGFYQYAIYLHCTDVYGINASSYHYRQHASSTMATSHKDRCYNYFATFDMVYDYMVDEKFLDDYKGKLFYILRDFSVNSVVSYTCCKRFFLKISEHYIKYIAAYNNIEVFFYNSIMDSQSYDEYRTNHRDLIWADYIRYGINNRNSQR